MMTAQVFSRAAQLAGELDDRQNAVLEALCGVSVSTLNMRLRDGLTPADCETEFVTAAALMALAVMNQTVGDTPVCQIAAGDFTVKKAAASADVAAACLMKQAQRIMAPYLKDRFAFLGV